MTNNPHHFDLFPLLELDLGSAIGQLRASPVKLNAETALLAVYCADFDVDPYVEMFFFPSDTLKMVLFTTKGEVIWQRDLGPGVVPGMWFCPVMPFDLDGDGIDEIWFVNNRNPQHPLAANHYALERIDAQTGKTTGQWDWPNPGGYQRRLSHLFRNFLIGGYANGGPVLVTAQGTYSDMYLQAYRPDMSHRWTHTIQQQDTGARGSHMCSVVDLNYDGIDELMWGERCISIDTGERLWCADENQYRGHSDIVQPVLDRKSGRWYIYTCRESDPDASPRVVLFDARGNRIWGAVEHGHIDMGWVARIGPERGHVAMAIRIGEKGCGPDGRYHQDISEFTFNALTGEPYPLPYSVYRTVPVDLNGDGYHELVRGIASGNGEVLDRFGNSIGTVEASVAMIAKFLDHPGEQMLAYYPDGTVRIWADRNAQDSSFLLKRCDHPYYQTNIQLTATGWNQSALTGV